MKAIEGIDLTWDAGVIEVVTIKGTKTWVNKHEQSEALPQSITVSLLANDKVLKSRKVTAADDWTYVFTGLDKLDGNHKKITYTTDEDGKPTPIPSAPAVPVGKEDKEAVPGKTGSLPGTATNIFNIAFFGGIFLLVGIAMYLARRKKV